MKNLGKFDVAVIGNCLAGCVCALQLIENGVSVIILSLLDDNATLKDIVKIHDTPFYSGTITGTELAMLINGIFDSNDVEYGRCAKCIDLYESGIRIVDADDNVIKVERVVYAPCGSEIGASDLQAERFYGLGVSMSASSDAAWYAEKEVAILGSGPRAAEEALMCVLSGVKLVNILSESFQPDFKQMGDEISGNPAIKVYTGVEMRTLNNDAEGKLQSVSFLDSENRRRDLEVKCLFLARGLKNCWKGFVDERNVDKALIERVVIPVGLAAGISYWDYSAQVLDGIRVAREVKSL